MKPPDGDDKIEACSEIAATSQLNRATEKGDGRNVRREPCKVLIFRGCKSLPGNWVAPAGSYRSDGGGNETVGAFETRRVALGDSASRQAVIASER